MYIDHGIAYQYLRVEFRSPACYTFLLRDDKKCKLCSNLLSRKIHIHAFITYNISNISATDNYITFDHLNISAILHTFCPIFFPVCVADTPGSSLRNVGICVFNIEAIRSPDEVLKEVLKVLCVAMAAHVHTHTYIINLFRVIMTTEWRRVTNLQPWDVILPSSLPITSSCID